MPSVKELYSICFQKNKKKDPTSPLNSYTKRKYDFIFTPAMSTVTQISEYSLDVNIESYVKDLIENIFDRNIHKLYDISVLESRLYIEGLIIDKYLLISKYLPQGFSIIPIYGKISIEKDYNLHKLLFEQKYISVKDFEAISEHEKIPEITLAKQLCNRGYKFKLFDHNYYNIEPLVVKGEPFRSGPFMRIDRLVGFVEPKEKVSNLELIKLILEFGFKKSIDQITMSDLINHCYEVPTLIMIIANLIPDSSAPTIV